MSYQAYLDAIEKQTGKTPAEIIELASRKGFGSDTKSGEVITWLKADMGLGHGHAAAMAGIIKNGAKISSKHVNSGGTHSDASDTLRLYGIKNR